MANIKRSLRSLFILPLFILPLSFIQAGPVEQTGPKTALVDGRSRRLLLDVYENLEDFTLEVNSFFPKVSRLKTDVFRLKRAYDLAKSEYDSSYRYEIFLYILGFKWLWGIFTLYRSTYITPSLRRFEQASRDLNLEEEKLEELKLSLKDITAILSRNLASLSSLSPLQDSRALRRVKAKLQRMNNQLEQLLVAIDSSLEFEASFDKAVSSAINRSVYKDTSSTSFYGDNVDNTFSYTRESDTVSRQVWDQAQTQRYQSESNRLKQEILNAKKTFEDLSSVVALKSEIDTYLANQKQPSTSKS